MSTGYRGTLVPLLGERLRAERERLGWSQQDVADKCDVTMRSQRNYEKGERLPDADYLGKFDRAGGDVLYVLTGRRSPQTAAKASTDKVNAVLLTRILTMLLAAAKVAGRSWNSDSLAQISVNVYEYLAKEEEVDDDKIGRVLKLVVNR